MRESLFWRVAFGAGFIVIGLGGLAESPWALTLVVLGVSIIAFNVWQGNRTKEAKQSSADKDLAEWQRITMHGQLEPTHTHVRETCPGLAASQRICLWSTGTSQQWIGSSTSQRERGDRTSLHSDGSRKSTQDARAYFAFRPRWTAMTDLGVDLGMREWSVDHLRPDVDVS